MKKRSASSLLLVLMIITGIVTVIFATQRIALIQFSQSTSEEDNLFAMYAAKSGIEDGMMRFRYSRNAETDNYQRVYYMQGKFTAEGVEAGVQDADYRPDQQYYDLNITYRTNSIARTLKKDETIELAGFSAGTNLNYSLVFRNCTGIKHLQFVRLVQSGSIFVERKESNDVTGGQLSLNAGDSLRITLVTSDLTCTVALNGTSDINFDGLTTYITSTGYYGAAKRTFIAEADRLTGNLVSVYEFTTFSGNEVRRAP